MSIQPTGVRWVAARAVGPALLSIALQSGAGCALIDAASGQAPDDGSPGSTTPDASNGDSDAGSPTPDGGCLNGEMRACGPCDLGVQMCANSTFGSCEGAVDTESSLEHCGQCDEPCELDNAIEQCVVGACEVFDCLEGFVDVNEQPEDGCECEFGPEVCDNIDNDCDNVIDEGFLLSASCDGIDADQCPDASFVCAPDHVRVCADQSNDDPEICGNDLDDDCDGATDETSMSDLCDLADNDCDGTVDEDAVLTAESCDGLDNDCDGVVDEFAAGQSSCYTGPAGTADTGVCSAGTTECRADAVLICAGEVTPSPEDCVNGADDDCDGTVDEGSAERCNGEDDDCDAAIDENPTNCAAGASCESGVCSCAGEPCRLDAFNVADATCSESSCDIVCESGTRDCVGGAANGCETAGPGC